MNSKAVPNIIRLYVAAGIVVSPPPNKSVETAIAKVPFCNPHSIDIAMRWFLPDAKSRAITYAKAIIVILRVRVIRPAWAK